MRDEERMRKMFDPVEVEWSMKPTREYIAEVLNIPVEMVVSKVVDGRPTITLGKAQARVLAVLARKAREAGL